MKVPLASMKASDPRRQERQGQPPRVAQMQGRQERQVLKGRRAPMAESGLFLFIQFHSQHKWAQPFAF